jgi:hypothetical protein
VKAGRQIGGRYLARVRGAFRGGQARLKRAADEPANPEPDGATRGTTARTGGRFRRKPLRASNVGLTERFCCGIELDAKYVDVVIQRWQTLSGRKATLDGDGRTFEEIAEERRKVPA